MLTTGAVEGHDFNGFDVYNIPDALDPEAPMDASVFLNGAYAWGAHERPVLRADAQTQPCGGNPRADEQELDGEYQLPLQCVPVMLAALLLLTSRGQTTRTKGLTRARSE